MSVLGDLKQEFSDDVVARGQEYFNEGRVSIIRAMNGKIVAHVRGSKPYTVTLLVEPDQGLQVECSCPYAAQSGPCKHIWATILKSDDLAILPKVEWLESVEEEEDPETEDDGESNWPPRPPDPWSRNSPDGRKGSAPQLPEWKRQIADLRRAAGREGISGQTRPVPLEGRRLIYVVKPWGLSYGVQELVIALESQALGQTKRTTSTRQPRLYESQISLLPDEQDRSILQMLIGVSASYDPGNTPVDTEHVLRPYHYDTLLKRICATGRCYVDSEHGNQGKLLPLQWDDGPAWEFHLECTLSAGGAFYVLSPVLKRGDERLEANDVLVALESGMLVTRTHITRLNHFGAFSILKAFRHQEQPMRIARADAEAAMEDLLSIHPLPRLDFPEELNIQRIRPTMQPRLRVHAPTKGAYHEDKLIGNLSYQYGQREIQEGQETQAFDVKTRTLLDRDAVAEAAARAELDQLKFKYGYSLNTSKMARLLNPARLSKVVLHLASKGWAVEAEGKLYRRAGEFKMEVSSGIDWFDLNGQMDFEGVPVSLPKLLAALKRGEGMVRLDDGTIGILPEEWLRKYALLASVAAKSEEGGIRFNRGQIGLLDALISEMPQVTFDEMFQQAREQIIKFEGIAAMDPAEGFKGTLRPYQREGLGWLHFLNRFGLGGCLADDMGLGKTIQVLSLLHGRKAKAKPSLVVVPRSLIFNWVEEARRFAPELRVLDHTGPARLKGFDHFSRYDMILTTYGTLRLDAPTLKEFTFDYAILDEAQAIKNGSSESAKAARLIRADHRLAMSGTPVQNHLGELWSLFEFLNPGMLGGASVFKATGKGNGLELEGREVLVKALRPFILRRTKEQVAKDLPEKTEQTIHCDMDPEQRKVYDELREHYRASLLNRIATEGIKKSKIQILEALLRLRQAACHPGLIDKSWIDKPAAKLEAMIPQICEVIEEDHKVLVFSQFTSMLAIVKRHLDKQNIVYEYLDGQTRDRQAKVDRFQTDPKCKVFLISLKAGGLGLNLTAAEYVFLLDPWWNPAIEAQAIDRAHRIGQTRKVFAYRFIANDTVEQKVLELQSRKKDLADMIINADNSLIGQLGKEDLEMLLS